MKIRVQKFGGTSLSTPEARSHVVRHIRQALRQEYKLVVVVSAMGRKGDPYATDTLLGLISQNGNRLPDREKDMLLCCGELISAATLCSLLNDEGIPSVVLNGAQAGILTDGRFGDAQILSIRPARVLELLELGQVVVVTGFQGSTASGESTTLGRGGSDTSATAIGVALGAEIVDIFTDVKGVLTADPKLVEDAKPLTAVSFAEICNMAYNGAKVIHPRAVEVAMQANLPIRIRSTFSDDEGTLVSQAQAVQSYENPISDKYVTAIAHVSGITQIRIAKDPEQEQLPLSVFKGMAKERISVDFINVNPSLIVYTVFDHEARRALEVLRALGCEPELQPNCAKVSVIGGGMNGVPGIMAQIVEALTDADITILQSSDSNTTIWVLVHGDELVNAVRLMHRKFQLHE